MTNEGGALDWAKMYDVRATYVMKTVTEKLGVADADKRIRIAVLPRPEFNASCTLAADGSVLVEVHIGAAFIAEDLFQRLLSHGGVWPAIGESTKEDHEVIVHDFYTRADDLFFHGAKSERYSRPAPRCSVRARYAGWLNSLVWDFIVLHELGHALHGHLQYGAAAGLAALDESGSVPPCQLDPLTRQALEMDADIFAVDCLLRRIDAPHEHLGRSSDHARRAGMAIDVLRATYTSFHLFCAGLKDLEVHQLDRAHPPPRVRQVLILSALLNWLNHPLETPEVTELALEPLQMEEHYVLLTGRHVYRDGIVSRLRDRHALEVMRRWRTIFPMVSAHAWTAMRAPPEE